MDHIHVQHRPQQGKDGRDLGSRTTSMFNTVQQGKDGRDLGPRTTSCSTLSTAGGRREGPGVTSSRFGWGLIVLLFFVAVVILSRMRS